MRKIKKYIKNLSVLYRNREKIRNTKNLLRGEFRNIMFEFASFGGADINYYLLKDNKRFAMLRLAIQDFKVADSIPIQRFEKLKRLEKEYQAYSIGSEYDLTPKVLYSFKDGLVCEYLDGERVFSILQKDKSKVWDILTEAVKTYRKLHDLGIVHLDATLKNFVMDNRQIKVIDFEYYPSKNLSIEVQKAYDYVRIIEHTLRTIPVKYQENYDEFIDVLDEIVPGELRDVDFTLVKQWLAKIETFPIYAVLKERIFTNLEFK